MGEKVEENNVNHQQYMMLREASWKRMEAQRNISVFMVTAVLAYFAFVVEIAETRPYLYLFPNLLIVPLAFKELDNKIAVSYIAAYQIAFLEDINNSRNYFTWETDFLRFKLKDYNKLAKKHIAVLADCEFAILSFVSLILYGIFAWNNRNKENLWHAVYQCRKFTEDELVLLLLGDMIINPIQWKRLNN